jgi:Rieske Fe-S protein
MTNADFTSPKRLAALLIVAVALSGCSPSTYKKGYSAAQNGDWDAAVEQYRLAIQEHPNNAEYKIALERAMLSASTQHLDAARLAEARLQLEEALREYRRASELDPPNRMLAAKVSDLKSNSAKTFRFGSRPGLLIESAPGEFKAMSATCTHLGCTVQYRADIREVWCACHNGIYDLNGHNVSGPPPRPLEQFEVQVRGDEIYVLRKREA